MEKPWPSEHIQRRMADLMKEHNNIIGRLKENTRLHKEAKKKGFIVVSNIDEAKSLQKKAEDLQNDLDKWSEEATILLKDIFKIKNHT